MKEVREVDKKLSRKQKNNENKKRIEYLQRPNFQNNPD